MSKQRKTRKSVLHDDNERFKLQEIEINGHTVEDNDMEIKIPKNDRNSIAILLFLYILQGIPLGLAGSIPLLLAKKVGYKQQAVFSFVYWPYSVKLLWAPFVDAAYFAKIGRRKTWLVPVQYLIGIFMLVLSKVWCRFNIVGINFRI